MGTAISNEAAALTYTRSLLCRLVFAFILVCLVYYQYSSTLVHQLRSPVLVFPYVDITYWIFHLIGVPEFITHNYFIACCFDLLLFSTCILTMIFPERRFLILSFFVLYFVYYIIFNSYGTQHTHSKIGILLIPVPFIFHRKYFYAMWNAMRYFTLFVYADAFLWKLFRGNFFDGNHGTLVLKKNFAAYLFYNPSGFFADIYTWLLERPGIVQLIFITGFIMEASFVLGFFTKRFDRFLLFLSLLLPVGFLFFSDAFFFELLVLSFTLTGFNRTYQKSVGTV